MPNPKDSWSAKEVAVAIIFIGLIYGLIFHFKRECEADGGHFVQGVIGYECIRR